MTIFISQPMEGKTKEEIQRTREKTIRKLKEKYPEEELYFPETYFYFNFDFLNYSPVWFLGRDIQLLAAADAIYFVEGWENYKGCKIEHEISKLYGIKILNGGK